MKSSRIVFSSAIAVTIAMGWTLPSFSQSMDYGSLQDLYGEPVTTSATGKPQKASEVPVAMIIIGADQISQAATNDIPGILKEYTDLDVWNESNGVSDVAIRGYNSGMTPRLLVLINGRQAYLDYYGFTNWSALPVELAEIRQIEVVKGPNAALFGFNAAAGVINIVTYNPLFDKVDAISARGGTQAYRDASGAVTFKFGDAAVRLGAGGSNANAFSTSNIVSTFPGNPGEINPQRREAHLDATVQVSPQWQAGVEASYGMTNLAQYTPSETFDDWESHFASVKGGVTGDTGLGQIEASAYRNMDFTHFLIGGTYYAVNDNVSVAKIQDLFHVGTDNAFRISGEYRYSQMALSPVDTGNVHYSVLSAGAMWDWSALPDLQITNAARFDRLALGRTGTVIAGIPYTLADYNQHTIDKVSANSGVVYKITDLDTIRADFGRGLQLPSLINYGLQSNAGIPLTGNPYLQPTIVTNYEIGYNRVLPDLGAKLTLSAFYETNDQLITSDISGILQGRPYQSINAGNSTAKGIELGLDGKSPGNFRWGITWRQEYIDDALTIDNSHSAFPIYFAGGTPHSLVSARAGYTIGRWDFDVFGRYSSAYAAPQGLLLNFPDSSVPASFTADARVAVRLVDGLTLSFHALDLQSKTTLYSGAPAAERQFYGELGWRF